MNVENTLIYLIGFPGVGKLTVARIVCARIGAKLVDNHLINNPIFSVIGADGLAPIPEPAWDNIQVIRRIVLDSIVNIAPTSFSFVLTNVLFDKPTDRAVFDQVAAVAEARAARLVPVILECAEHEMVRRLAVADRATRLKMTDVEAARQIRREHTLMPVEHCNLLRLDTTYLSAEASADAILTHLGALA